MNKETVISGLHCRAQDLMIDLPACDKCDYQIQIVNRMGCDFRRLCKDALALLEEQKDVVRCKDCKHYDGRGNFCAYDPVWQKNKWHIYGLNCDPNWFCADGERKSAQD